MADYNVQVDLNINGESKLNSLEQRLNKMKNTKIDLGLGGKGSTDPINKATKELGKVQSDTQKAMASASRVTTSQLATNLKKDAQLQKQYNQAVLTDNAKTAKVIQGRRDALYKENAGLYASKEWRNATSDQKSRINNIKAETAYQSKLANARQKDFEVQQARAIQTKYDSGIYKQQLEKMESKWKANEVNINGKRSNPLDKQYIEAKKAFNDFDNTVANGKSKDYLKQSAKFAETQSSFWRNAGHQDSLRKGSQGAIDLEIAKLRAKEDAKAFQSYNTKAKKLAKDMASNPYNNYLNQVKDIDNMDAAQLRRLNSQRQLSQLQLNNSGLGGKTFLGKLKDKVGDVGSYLSSSVGIGTAIAGAKSIYDNVVKVDTAMTNLKKVTDESDSTYRTFFKNAKQGAIDTSSSVDGFIESTAQFARLGYNIKDATQLAKVANTYNTVGDEIKGGIEGASQSIISTMKAFDYNAENSMDIADKFNSVGKLIA